MLAAVVQLTATADAEANVATADRLVREAVSRGARLVVLPEKWAAIGPGETTPRLAQTVDGPAARWARAVALELGIDLVAGSFTEAHPGRDRATNTSLHVGPDGGIRARYEKLHLFDVEVDGTTYRESAHEAPGTEVVVTELADGTKLGMSVCYDLRFPELYRELVARGATVLAVPAAFTLATTRDHWEILVRARAIEDQCYVLAANQVGEHAPGLRSGGRSMIVDPWGLVLAQVPDGEGVALADLDAHRQAGIRARIPALRHRRREVL